MIFNAVNGTIDLTTGELLKHNPNNLITKRAACEMAPVGAEHPLWSAFVDRIFEGPLNSSSLFSARSATA